MANWYCSTGGQQYGPVPFEALKEWADKGLIRGSDHVWSEGMPNWVQASTVPNLISLPAMPSAGPYAMPGAPSGYVAPHRGGVVLTLGILGLVVCVICGIIAWVMGNSDLREMRAGRMDRSGEGTTQAGRICGMISCILAMVGVGVYLIIMLFMGAALWQH